MLVTALWGLQQLCGGLGDVGKVIFLKIFMLTLFGCNALTWQKILNDTHAECYQTEMTDEVDDNEEVVLTITSASGELVFMCYAPSLQCMK